MEELKFTRNPKLKNPCMIVAWPGMGEVAFRAASHLVESLQAIEFAEIPAHDFFYLTGSVVQNGILSVPELPSGKFYYWKNPGVKGSAAAGAKSSRHDLIIFVSNGQPDLARAGIYCERIISLAKKYKVKMISGFAAMPQPVDHTQDPNVWFTSTSKSTNDKLVKFGLAPLAIGQISGMNGLFLGFAKKAGLDGFCLLGEIPLYTIQIENPKASNAVLQALGRILDIKINPDRLMEQARAMEDQINKLLDFLKLSPPSGPINEEDIEKIKNSLSQLTQLPTSVKEKIEQLFAQAKADISKAAELKIELDRWNAYKEYEDRFLDLFRNRKNNSN